MNGRKGTESIIVSFFEYYEGTLLIKESNKYFHFEMLIKLVELNWENISLGRNCKYGSNDMYFFELLSYLWKIGLRNLFLLEKNERVFYSKTKYSSFDIEERLVEIYYDVLDNNIKDNYIINDREKLEAPEYQNFIKKYLPLESKGQITINQIPLDKLVLSDS